MEIAAETEDVRVQRSRELLQHALFELVIEKGFTAVTVRDIARRAKVNRSTFYRHYLNKYDLLNRYLDQLQRHVAEAASRAENTAVRERVPGGLLLLVQHIQEHAPFYRVMLGTQGDQAFTHRFRQVSEQRYRSLVARFADRSAPQDPPTELQVQYISYAFVGAVLWWLENDQPSSAEQFALWLSRLSLASAGLTLQQLKLPSS
jgi:AcrR family transcriptional regulator